MFSRITLVLITAFWLCMNFLLWRSEFGGRNHIGAKIPVAVVWQKILTAPDKSQLEISHHGRKIGDCQWSASVGQDFNGGKILTEGAPPDGPASEPTSYTIDFGGTFSLLDTPTRLGFSIVMNFTTNREWQEFNAILNLRPDRWNVHSRASEQTLRLRIEGEDEKSDRIYKFSDLRNPQFLIQEFQLPISLQLLDAVGLTAAGRPAAPISLGLDWEAHNDWITIGQTYVRAYRLEARILDRYRIVVIVSEVGEILRVELPDEWMLVNHEFSDL